MEGMHLKLKILTAVIVLFSLLLFGCIPENDIGKNSEAEQTTAAATTTVAQSTAATTKKGGSVFGEVEDEGSFPEIPFDEFK